MKMTELSSYDAQGRITACLTVPESMIDLQVDGIVYGRAEPATEYVLDRTIVPRPPCPAVLSGTTLTSLPLPATLFVNGDAFEATESTVELTFSRPGQYSLRVVCWPYLDGNFMVRI